MKTPKAQSVVAIMLVIAFLALILRFAIEQVIKLNVSQNESLASAQLKLIATALENYAKDNNGAYPVNLSVAINTQPPYLDKDYIALSPFKGYNYACSRLEPTGYSCEAVPLKCKVTGSLAYSISTGGAFVWEDCSRKE